MAEVERTKFVKTFVHPSDDFEVTDDEGTVYHPHAGEWVRFRSDIPWEVVRMREGITNAEYHTALVHVFQRQIRDWNWTDDDGQPLPKPGEDGFEDALWSLGAEERAYLRAHFWDSSKAGEA